MKNNNKTNKGTVKFSYNFDSKKVLPIVGYFEKNQKGTGHTLRLVPASSTPRR